MRVPAEAVRVDLTGKTVIPALIDTHIHIGYQRISATRRQLHPFANLNDRLRRYAYLDVAAVMTLGTDPGELPFQVRVGPRRISRFLNDLARPHVTPKGIETGYADMAAEEAREAEAAEWSEGLIGDVADEPR